MSSKVSLHSIPKLYKPKGKATEVKECISRIGNSSLIFVAVLVDIVD